MSNVTSKIVKSFRPFNQDFEVFYVEGGNGSEWFNTRAGALRSLDGDYSDVL